MNILNLIQKLNSDEFKGVEKKLITRRRNGAIAGWAAIFSGIIQVIIILLQNDSAENLRDLFQVDLKSISTASYIPVIFLFFGLLFYFLYRRTSFLFSQSKEPYRYTFFVEPFKEIKTLEKSDFKFKNKERFELLHHDITELICQRIKRFSVLKEYNSSNTEKDELKIPDYRKSSHIHIYGNYTIREDRNNDEWIVQVMPYVRIGDIDAPARMAQTIRFPLLTNITPEEFDVDEYNQLIERVYSRIATEIYAQIDTDIRKKINLFPTKFLRASFLYHEAKDMAKSNTIDAFERAITLFEESKRYCDVTIRKVFNNFFVKIPVLRTLIAPYQHIMTRIQIGLATSLVYKSCLSSYAGKKMNPLFAPLKDIKEVQKKLEYLHKKISPGNKFSRNSNNKEVYFSLTYLAYPKDTWLRKLLLQPSSKFFNENRRILFNAYVVESLIYSRLSSMKEAERSLNMARAIAPDRCTEDARYLLAEAYIQPDVEKAISLLREATEKDPSFQIAQYELAFWMELTFRRVNIISKLRAKVVLDEYDKVLKLNPGNIMALAAQGYLHWLLHENEAAQRKYQEGCEIKTIVRDTFTAQLVYGLARIKAEIKFGDSEKSDSLSFLNEAYDLFNHAISVDPNIGAYSVGTSITKTSSSYSFITLQILKRFKEFSDTVQNNVNRARKEQSSEILKKSENIIYAVKAYALNEYGNACYNYYLRYGDQNYLDEASECYDQAIKLDPENVTSKFNRAATIRNLIGSDFILKNTLLKEVKDKRPDWIDGLGLYAMSLAMALRNREKNKNENTLTEKIKKSKTEDSNVISEKTVSERSDETETIENILLEFDELIKLIFNTANRLSALYSSLEPNGNKVDELLSYPIKWEQLDYDDVMALKVWAQYLYSQTDKNCIKLINHIITNYYHEDIDLHIFKKDFLVDHSELLEISKKEQENEIKKCEEMTNSILEYWLKQDTIYYDTLLLAKTHSVELYNTFIKKAYSIEKSPAIANQLGNFMFQKNNYDKAIDYYLEALEMDEKAIFASNLGRAYGKCGNWEEMMKQCTKAVILNRKTKNNYNDFDYYYEYLAMAYKELDRIDDFVKLFEQSVDLINMTDAQKAIVHNRVGNLYSDVKNYTSAIDSYHKAIALDPLPIYVCNLGRTYGETGDYENMITFCKQAVNSRLENSKDNYELDYYYDYLGEAYLNNNQIDGLTDLIHSTNFLNKDLETKAYLLDKAGNFMRNSKRFDDAVSLYQEAIDLDPKPVYLSHLGMIYGYDFGNWHKMADYFTNAFKKKIEKVNDPQNISYYLTYMAKAYFMLGKIPRFMSILNYTEELNDIPKDKALIINHIGNLYGDKGDFISAIHFYKKAIKVHNLAVYTYNIALSQLKSNKYEEAVETFRKAIILRKDQKEGELPLSTYYENQAIAYGNMGKIEEFINLFEDDDTFDTLLKEKALIYNRIGNVYFSNSEFENSLMYYEKAMEFDHQPIFENNLGLALTELKEWSTAIIHFKNVIEMCRIANDKELLLSNYENLAKAYFISENISGFIDYIESQNDFDDDKSTKASLFARIAKMFKQQLEYEKSVDFLLKALALVENTEYRMELAFAYSILNKKDIAIQHYKICLKNQLANNDLIKNIYSTCTAINAFDFSDKKTKIDVLADVLSEIDSISGEDKNYIVNEFKKYDEKVHK